MLDGENSTDQSFPLSLVPVWLKISYTVFVVILVPVYWKQYGPGNFLWFSDIALLTTTITLWLENSLLASMMALSTLLLELIWNVDFFVQLGTSYSLVGLSSYMFDQKIPRAVRALSLFHVVLPPLFLWLLHRLGYDRRALPAQAMLAAVVLASSYVFTAASENVNWVRGFGETPQALMPPVLYLVLLMILFPTVIYWPTHVVLKRLF